MQQRVRQPHRGINPSSVPQLPIWTALYARFPTLFTVNIPPFDAFVNTQKQIYELLEQITFMNKIFGFIESISKIRFKGRGKI